MYNIYTLGAMYNVYTLGTMYNIYTLSTMYIYIHFMRNASVLPTS